MSRDLDSNPGTTGNNYNLSNSYNLRGDPLSDNVAHDYKWDAFGRLVEVSKGPDAIAVYRYNGLNQRITWHYDADEDADVDGSDPVYHFCYDDKWRIVGVWRGADTDPKELFIYHAAGVAGYGGSSYIDSVILRDRDNSSKWSQASDGTLETRHYFAQNWRADVSVIFDNAGAVIEWQKYSAYGVPFLLTPGDHEKNGGISAADQTAFNADFTANSPRADLNRDGAWTTADQTLFTASYNAAAVGGRWKLSAGDVGNRKGYAGYEHEGFGNDLAAPEIAHVRHRVLHFGLGRWTSTGASDGMETSSEMLRHLPAIRGGDHTQALASGSSPTSRERECRNRAGEAARSQGIQPDDYCHGNFIEAYYRACMQGMHREDNARSAYREYQVCAGANGCGAADGIYIPDLFPHCCNEHDLCYGTCFRKKEDCDSEFLSRMIKNCLARPFIMQYNCVRRAHIFYGAVSGFGDDAYAKGQKGCVGPPNVQ